MRRREIAPNLARYTVSRPPVGAALVAVVNRLRLAVTLAAIGTAAFEAPPVILRALGMVAP